MDSAYNHRKSSELMVLYMLPHLNYCQKQQQKTKYFKWHIITTTEFVAKSTQKRNKCGWYLNNEKLSPNQNITLKYTRIQTLDRIRHKTMVGWWIAIEKERHVNEVHLHFAKKIKNAQISNETVFLFLFAHLRNYQEYKR